MLKLAFSTLPCATWSADKMLEYCLENGYRGIELREDSNSWVSVLTPKEERIRIQKLFKNANVEVSNIGSGIRIDAVEPVQGIDEMKHLVDIVHLAKDLKAKGIRIFLGNNISRRDAPKPLINYEGIVSWVKNACDYAAQYGIGIWIETHNEFATGKALRVLLDDVNRQNCKVIWDIIHPLEEQEKEEETLDFLKKQCAHVHIKDGVPKEDPMEHNWKYTRLGEGQIPIKSIISLLLESGYDGYFSLEWETRWRKELQVEGNEPEKI